MWLYVPSVCSPEPEDSTSPLRSPVRSSAFVTSNGKRMPPAYWSRVWKKGGWIRRLSGLTLPHSTAAAGVDAWISSLRGSRVSHSAPRPEGAVSQSICGQKPFVSFENPGRGSCFSKTCSGDQSSAPGTTSVRWVTAPLRCPSTPPRWVPRLHASDTGYLPTITRKNNQHSPSMQKWPAYRRLALLTGGRSSPARVLGMDDEPANRMDRISLLGNGVDVLAGAVAFDVLLSEIGL